MNPIAYLVSPEQRSTTCYAADPGPTLGPGSAVHQRAKGAALHCSRHTSPGF
jgi:hypothetical protein